MNLNEQKLKVIKLIVKELSNKKEIIESFEKIIINLDLNSPFKFDLKNAYQFLATSNVDEIYHFTRQDCILRQKLEVEKFKKYNDFSNIKLMISNPSILINEFKKLFNNDSFDLSLTPEMKSMINSMIQKELENNNQSISREIFKYNLSVKNWLKEIHSMDDKDFKLKVTHDVKDVFAYFKLYFKEELYNEDDNTFLKILIKRVVELSGNYKRDNNAIPILKELMINDLMSKKNRTVEQIVHVVSNLEYN